jgi:hypothetical protein
MQPVTRNTGAQDETGVVLGRWIALMFTLGIVSVSNPRQVGRAQKGYRAAER